MNCEVLDEARSVEVAIIISYPKREWDNFFFFKKRPQNIENSSHLYFKRTDFQLVLISSRLVQLPYLDSIAQWLIYQDG